NSAVSANQKVRRYPQAAQSLQPWMGTIVEPVQKQVGDFLAAEYARRQRNIMNDEQADGGIGRAQVEIGRRRYGDARSRPEPAMTIQRTIGRTHWRIP